MNIKIILERIIENILYKIVQQIKSFMSKYILHCIYFIMSKLGYHKSETILNSTTVNHQTIVRSCLKMKND